jgi:predicted Ser/Thr protein kinase
MTLVPNVKTMNGLSIYLKNNNKFYNSKNKQISGTTLVKKNNHTFKLSEAIQAKNHEKTNLTHQGYPVYKKNNTYFLLHLGKLTKLSPFVNFKKPNGNLHHLYPNTYEKYFKKTEYTSPNGAPIYFKVPTKTYYRVASGKLQQIVKTTLVTKNGVTKPLSQWMVPPTGIPPGYVNTGFKSEEGFPIIKHGTIYYAYKGNGKLAVKFKGKAKFMTTHAAQGAPAAPAAVVLPSGAKNTGSKSTNGYPIVQLANSYYVYKNGHLLLKFKGKANFMKKTVSITTLVPVIEPGPDFIKSKETIYTEKVKAVADKLKELRSIDNAGQNKNINALCAKSTGMAHSYNMAAAYLNRKNTMYYNYTYVEGFVEGGNWKQSLTVPQFRYAQKKIVLNYNQFLAHQQLLFIYGRDVKSPDDLRISDIMDMKWFEEQDAYIRSLTSRQLFTVFGYTYQGDTYAHAYLDNKLVIDDITIPHYDGTYFPFFFQAREYFKVSKPTLEFDYAETLRLLRVAKNEGKKEVFVSIIQMFINELNEIIQKSPSVSRAFITFRGNKNDRYLSAKKNQTDDIYTTQRFCSATIDGTTALQFSQGHNLQRITILRGSKCLLLFGLTKFPQESEILFPRGSTYRIVNQRAAARSTRYTVQNAGICMTRHSDLVKRLEDVVLYGTVLAEPAVEQVQVPVQVPENIKFVQNRLVRPSTKITGLLSNKGSNGRVYTAVNNGKNTALKIQKKTNRSNVEVAALRKLKAGLVRAYNLQVTPNKLNMLRKIVPRPIQNGNKVSIIQTNYIKGRPLRNFMTGPPLNQALKNKIAQAITNIHKKGVIHGDLHRNNIIIGNNGKVHLIDYGRALVTTKRFKNTKTANEYLKSAAIKKEVKNGKNLYFTKNNTSHYLNGNFLKRLV